MGPIAEDVTNKQHFGTVEMVADLGNSSSVAQMLALANRRQNSLETVFRKIGHRRIICGFPALRLRLSYALIAHGLVLPNEKCGRSADI